MHHISGIHRADVAIWGDDLAAWLLGSALSHAGMRVTLLIERDGSVSSCRSLGTVLHASACRRIEAAWGTEYAHAHVAALQAQLQGVAMASLPYLRHTAVCMYARTRRELSALEAQQVLFSRLRISLHAVPDGGGCPFPVEAALLLPGQIQADLSLWMGTLRKAILHHGGRILTRASSVQLEPTRLRTGKACIEAPQIVLVSDMLPGLRDFRLLSMLESRRIVHCSLTGGPPLQSWYLPAVEDGLVLQPDQSGMIASLDAGRCGTRHVPENLAGFGDVLARRMPDAQAQAPFYTRQVQSADGLPMIGVLPGSRRLCAAAYGEWGLLGALLAAQVLTRRILGQPHPEDALYAPDRKYPKGLMHRQQRRLLGLYAANAARRSIPACAHCGCRMRYAAPASRWECPVCGSSCTMLGDNWELPGMHPARVSARQRPGI